MFDITGKYATAKVFTDIIEQEAISQIMTLCNQPFAEGSSIRIMPDVHAGAGCTIGTTMTITDKIVPNLVGVDIGCGMDVNIIDKDTQIDLGELDSVIRKHVPSGFDIRDSVHRYARKIDLNYLHCRRHVNVDRAELSLGTLGGGNHFIELNRGEDGTLYLVIHSGSRHLGVEVATYYQNKAWEILSSRPKADVDAIIAQLKAEGRQSEIQSTLQSLGKFTPAIPKDLAYVEGQLFDDYIHDMHIVQRFAMWNRFAIADVITREMGIYVSDKFTTVHNYIDTQSMILRKGAVNADAGRRLIIPLNMRDGSLICRGKGNLDWNCSAPHGAGRLYSRSKAKEMFAMDEFRSEMQGVYTTSVCESTIDEAPMAYKAMEDIIGNIGDTVEVIERIVPIYNFKAH